MNKDNLLSTYFMSCGFLPPEIIADSNIHRFKRDPSNKRNDCWYLATKLLLSSGKESLSCTFGDWKTGEKHHFSNRDSLDQSQQRELHAKRNAHMVALDKNIRALQSAAKEKANLILKKSTLTIRHSYLDRKSIVLKKPITIYKGSLAIPMVDLSGQLLGIQFIGLDDTKRFLSGQQVKGAVHLIGEISESTNVILVVEGFATGYSVHAATALPVFCVFTASNLISACPQIKAKYPGRKIIICADDDRWTNENPGVSFAKKAVHATGGSIAIPEFKNLEKKPTDFNDLHVLEGLKEVRKQVLARYLKLNRGVV